MIKKQKINKAMFSAFLIVSLLLNSISTVFADNIASDSNAIEFECDENSCESYYEEAEEESENTKYNSNNEDNVNINEIIDDNLETNCIDSEKVNDNEVTKDNKDVNSEEVRDVIDENDVNKDEFEKDTNCNDINEDTSLSIGKTNENDENELIATNSDILIDIEQKIEEDNVKDVIDCVTSNDFTASNYGIATISEVVICTSSETNQEYGSLVEYEDDVKKLDNKIKTNKYYSYELGTNEDNDSSKVININKNGNYIEGEVIIIKKDTNKLINSVNSLGASSDGLDEYSALLNEAEVIYTLNENNTSNEENFEKLQNSNNGVITLGSAQSDISNKNIEKNNKDILYLQSNNYTTEELIENLSKLPNVESVEPNKIYNFSDKYVKKVFNSLNKSYSNNSKTVESTNLGAVEESFQLGETNAVTPTNFTDKQWSLKEGEGDYKYSIKVPNWNDNSHKNTEGIVVAVIDDGIDLNHPDLKNILWSDGNIYTTTLGGGKYGFNSIANTNNNDNNFVSTDPSAGVYSHGTHVAGIIAAEWNSYGVSGICNGAKILPIRVMNDHGDGSVYSAILAYRYLIELKKQGVNIVCANNSWGGKYENLAIKLMAEEAGKYNIATVFASGNDTKDVDIYPDTSGGLKNVDCGLSVDSSDKYGVLAAYSNYGQKSTDVVAPGSAIASCINTRRKTFNEKMTGIAPIKKTQYITEDESQGFFPVNSIEYGSHASFVEFSSAGEGQDAIGYLKMKSETKNNANFKFVSKGFENGFSSNKLYLNYAISPSKGKKIEYDTLIPVKQCNADGTAIAGAEVFDYKVATASYYVRDEKEDNVCVDLNAIYTYENEGITYYCKPYLGNNTTDKFYFWVVVRGYNNHTDLKLSPYEFFIGDIKIYANDPIPYDFMDGTSMACPTACGALAVIAKQYSTATPSEWIALLKGSTDNGASRVPTGNKGKLITIDTCLSGGIVNLKDALLRTTRPVVNKISLIDKSTDMWKYEIDGFFFGDSVNDIKISGKSFKNSVISWKDRKVVFETTDNIGGGNQEVRVIRTGDYWGRNFFNIDENVNNNTFASLPLYTGLSESDAFNFKTSKICDSIATNNNVYFLTTNTNNYYQLFSYNINTRKWSKKFDDILDFSYTNDYYSFKSNFVERDGMLYAIFTKTNVANKTYDEDYFVFKYDTYTNTKTYIPVSYTDSNNAYVEYSTLYVDNDDDGTMYLFGGVAYSTENSDDFLSNSIYIVNEKSTGWTISPTEYTLPKKIEKAHATVVDKDSSGKWCIYLTGGKVWELVENENKEVNDYSIIKVTFNGDDSISTSIYDNRCTSLYNCIADNMEASYISVKNGFYLIAGFTGDKNAYKFDVPKKKATPFGIVTMDTISYVAGDSYDDKAYVLADSIYTEGIRVFKTFEIDDFEPDKPSPNPPYVPSGGGSGGGGGGSGSIGVSNPNLISQNSSDLPTNDIMKIEKFDDKMSFEYDPIHGIFGFSKVDEKGNKAYVNNKWILVKNNDKNDIYLTDNSGCIVTGYVMKDDKLYYMSQEPYDFGKMKRGFVYVNGQLIYFNKQGVFADDPKKAPLLYKVLK